jgi:hypothetical protein
MPGHHHTTSEYAQQRVVKSFCNLLFRLEEHGSTHTYCEVCRFVKLENIAYLVVIYLRTGLLPFEKYSEEWLLDGTV